MKPTRRAEENDGGGTTIVEVVPQKFGQETNKGLSVGNLRGWERRLADVNRRNQDGEILGDRHACISASSMLPVTSLALTFSPDSALP